MTATKAFPTLDVLSAITGRLVSEDGIGGVYAVLGFMSGGDVYTHQIPRVGQEAAAAMLEFRPDLAIAIEEAKGVTRDNWQVWARTWIDRYGPEMTVPVMTGKQHRRIDPITELRQMVPDKPIVVVTLPGTKP